jgi:HSP20 family protein
MANISKRTIKEWEPLRFMREMMRWDDLERLGSFIPDFEVKETDGSYVIRADVPGIPEKDLEVTISGNMLTVAGKREEEKKEEGEKFYAYERSYGRFSRSFVLPEGVDTEHVATELKDGVLTLALPRVEKAATRKIEIKRGKAS